MRQSMKIILSLAALLLPVAALANMYMPSLVEFLVAPGPFLVVGVYALFSVPILLVIAMIEAAAVKPLVMCSYAAMAKKLFWINVVTTSAGLVYSFGGLPLWAGVMAAFLGTTALEWLLLFRVRDAFRVKSARHLLRAALRMNTASYAVIALVLLILIAPTWGNTDPSIRHDFTGTIRMSRGQPNAVTRDARTGMIRAMTTAGLEDPAVASNTVPPKDRGSRVVAVSHDGRYALLFTSKIVEMGSGKETPLGKEALNGVFSPTENTLAVTDASGIMLYACETGEQRRLPIPGTVTSRLAWSPDGKYIAYLGETAPGVNNRFRPDLRAVRVRDGKSVTIYSKIFTVGAPWIRLSWE